MRGPGGRECSLLQGAVPAHLPTWGTSSSLCPRKQRGTSEDSLAESRALPSASGCSPQPAPLHSRKAGDSSQAGICLLYQPVHCLQPNRVGTSHPTFNGGVQAGWAPVLHPHLFSTFLPGLIEKVVVSRPQRSPFFFWPKPTSQMIQSNTYNDTPGPTPPLRDKQCPPKRNGVGGLEGRTCLVLGALG